MRGIKFDSDDGASGPVATSAEEGTVESPFIKDEAPQRVRDKEDLIRIGGDALIIAAAVLVAVYLTGLTAGVQSDMQRALTNASWIITAPISFLSQLSTVVILGWCSIQMLINREWLQTVSAALSLTAGYIAIYLISWGIAACGNAQVISALVSNRNISGSLLPDMFCAMTAFLTAAGPRRLHSSVRNSWIILTVLVAVLIIANFESPAGSVVSLVSGRIIGLIARYILGSPSFGAWGRQVTNSMQSIGLRPTVLVRRAVSDGRDLADGLVPNSRIYDMTCDDDSRYVVSVSDEQRHISGYLRQLWQIITLTGVTHRTDRSVRSAVRHHRNVLIGLRHMGLPQLDPYEVTYSKESAILVLNTSESLSPCDWETVTDDDIADAMAYLRRANDRGYTNRLIHPGSFARTHDGRLIVSGWDIGDDGSNAANIAIDRVQMLAALMCTVGLDRTILCGIRAWGREEMAALQPYVQSAVIPVETVHMKTWDRRRSVKQLRERLGSLIDVDESSQIMPVTVTRFSAKSIFSTVLIIVAVVAIFTQLNLNDMIAAIKGADPGMAFVCFIVGCVAWLGMSITLTAFMDKGRRNMFAAFMAQITTSFTAVSMPAGIGPAFVNLQFLRKSGYKNSVATAIMSAVVCAQVITTVVLIVFVGLFTGRNMLSNVIPTGTVAIVLVALFLVIAVAMLVPAIRNWLQRSVMPVVRQYAHQLVSLLSQPARLVIACLGSIMQNMALGVSFWAALMAFGYHTNVIETTFLYLLSNAIGSAVPTPGGLGGVEAMLFATFSGTGVPSAIAMSATMLFRVLTYWIRIPMGALSMKWLDNRNLI